LNFIQIGSISIPATWVGASLALFLAFLIYRVLSGKKVGEWYWNSFFLYFLIWKLSYIAFDLKFFIDFPLSVLYYNGGIKGHFLALAILSIYLLFFAVKKYHFITADSPHLFLLYFICYEAIINFLEKSSMEAISNLILLAGYLFLHKFQNWRKNVISNQIYILLVLLILLLLSIFHTIFSVNALTIIWEGVTVFILLKKINKEDRSLE
jgi:hypothetical protein